MDLDGDIDLVVSGDGDSRLFVLQQTAPAVFEHVFLDEGMGQAGGMKVTDFNQMGPRNIGNELRENALVAYVLNIFPGLPGKAQQPEWTQIEEGTSVRVTFDDTESGPLVLAIFDEYPPTGHAILYASGKSREWRLRG